MQENQQPFTQYDQQGDKIINPGTLTKLEHQYLQQAKLQHKQNLTKQQRVGTKVFKGSAFIAKPDTILFKDFTVGKSHILVITLTNVSNAFNSFNVLPLPQKIRNYFEVEFIPKGKISPGITCDIKFKFIPQFNEDIQSQFSILSQTGKISYPIICTSKKTIVKCNNSTVDFGQIIFGETGQGKLYLNNIGTLPSQMIFQTLNGIPINKCQEEKEIQKLRQIKFDTNNIIEGNVEKIMNFQLKPQQIGSFQLKLQLYVKNFIYSPPILITFKGSCIQVPVTIQKSLYDFEICLLNHIYREKLIFYNRGETTMSFKMIQTTQSKKYFQFNPVIGYIQKQSKMEVWIKLAAQKHLPAYLNKYMKQPNIYIVPFHMSVKQQLLPVNFQVKFQITSEKINITPSQLNFGTIYEGLSSKIQLTLENESDLAQQVLINPIKKQLFIQNDQPLFKILPKQTIKASIIYRSKSLEENGKPFKDEGSIACKIITGDIATNQIKLDYYCQTIRPDIFIQNNKIDLPALQIDQVCNATTLIKNNSNKQIIFQIVVPYFEICGLKLTPLVRALQPKQEVELNIQYHSQMRKLGPLTMKTLHDQYNKKDIKDLPPKEVIPPQQIKKQTKKEVKKETKLSKQEQQQLELKQKQMQEAQRERKAKQQAQRLQLQRNFNIDLQLNKIGGKMYDFGGGQHYSWIFPVYFKQKQYPDVSAERNFIQITTTAIEKVLETDVKEVDFGEIAVGGRAVKQIKVLNKGQKTLLKKKQLPIFCCFNVLNSMKQIEKDGHFKAVVQFQPTQQQKFNQKLSFFTSKHIVSCILKGKGVRPQVCIDPQSGILILGSVVLDQFSEKTFKIKNICHFEVKFQLKKMQGNYSQNSSKAITYTPEIGTIQPNNSIEIKVRFKPDKIGEKYFEQIKVHVPEQKCQKFLYIWGACYPRQAYVLEQKQKKIPSLVDENSQLDNIKIKQQDNIVSATNKRILLQYLVINEKNKDSEACYKRKITIGSCKLLDPKLQKPTNFEIIMPKDNRFQCDNLKGAVPAGSQLIVTFTYKPEDPDPLITKIPILCGIGQWKDIKCQLKLSGGFIKPGGQDILNLQVILRVYVNQL